MRSDPANTTASLYADKYVQAHLPAAELWPELIFSVPELQYPARFNVVDQLLDHALAQRPELAQRPALYGLVNGNKVSLNYAELAELVSRIAQVLVHDLGLPSGARVLLRGSNSIMLAASILAVMKAGMIAVPTMPLLRARELAVIIEKAQIAAALCAEDLSAELQAAQTEQPVLKTICYFHSQAAAGLEQLLQKYSAQFSAFDTSASDVALIGFTSGTTGKPKATLHFHRDVLAICDCFPRSILATQPDDIFVGTPPLAFTFGLGGLLLFPLRYGAAAVLLEKLSPATLLAAIAEYRASICFTAPTFYRQMTGLVEHHQIASLKKSVSAGEALPASTRHAWHQATGLQMIDGIGATEMLHIFISATPEQARAGATGKPIPGYQACILDPEGRVLGPGQIGRLAVKGPTGCRYLDDPRQRDYVWQGWNLTGDAYELDQDGYFHYRARIDDMIISAGYNIAGPEVEEAVLRHPAAAECAVIGVDDEQRGQLVKAFVVLKAGYQASDELAKALQDFVKQTIAPYKYPRCIEFRTQLPRTETGKLQRFKLKQATS